MSLGLNTHWSSRWLLPGCLFLIVLLAVVLAPGTARAGSEGVDIVSPVPVLLDVSPGGTTTASFLVVNRSSRLMEVAEDVELPEGWSLVIGASSFVLSPGEERLRLVMFHIPQCASPGSYYIGYGVTDKGGGISCREEVSVTVIPQGKLELILHEGADRVVAGSPLAARLTLLNHSNVSTQVSLSLTSSESYLISPDVDDFVLEAGEVRDIDVSVETPPDAPARVEHVIIVEAEAHELDDHESRATIAVVQTVLPKVSSLLDPYRRLPSRLKTTYVRGGGASGVATEFSGSGKLDAQGLHGVELLVRTPDTRDITTFGLRDEYSLRFRGRGYDARLGDAAYGLSRLAGQRRLGRGGSIALDVGDWQFGGSYFGARTGEPENGQGAMRVGYRPGERFSLGFNLFDASGDGMDILSAECSSEPLENLDLDLELAARSTNRRDRAYWVRARGNRGRARFFLERIAAGRGFDGRFSDENHTTASIAVPVYGGLAINAFYRDYENRDRREDDVDDGIEVSSITHEEARSIGLRVNLSSSLRGRIDYRDILRRGATSDVGFRYGTRTAKAALDYVRGNFNVVSTLEFGRLDDYEESVSSSVTTHSLSLTLWPTKEWRVSGHFRSALAGSPDPSNSSSAATLASEFRFAEDMSMRAGARWTSNRSAAQRGPDEVTAGFDYALPFRHTITGDVRWRSPTGVGDESETSISLAYEIPFDTRLGRRKDVGSLRGRIETFEGSSKTGVPDAVLMLGEFSAVTDENGDYVFPGIVPGDYSLSIGPSSIGLDGVPLEPLPRNVAIEGGSELRLDVEVAPPGRIEGFVGVAAAANDRLPPTALPGHGRLPPLVVEATNGSHSLRRLTDAHGRFCFDRLCPGCWTVEIRPDGLPRFCGLDCCTFTVDVRSGGMETVTASIESSVNEIPIIETGDVRLSSRPD